MPEKQYGPYFDGQPAHHDTRHGNQGNPHVPRISWSAPEAKTLINKGTKAQKRRHGFPFVDGRPPAGLPTRCAAPKMESPRVSQSFPQMSGFAKQDKPDAFDVVIPRFCKSKLPAAGDFHNGRHPHGRMMEREGNLSGTSSMYSLMSVVSTGSGQRKLLQPSFPVFKIGQVPSTEEAFEVDPKLRFYAMDEGMNYGYGGHVPGAKFVFGETYGNATRRLLKNRVDK